MYANVAIQALCQMIVIQTEWSQNLLCILDITLDWFPELLQHFVNSKAFLFFFSLYGTF